MRISGWRTTFSSLENRTYRLYWISLLTSFSAQQMHLLLRGWLVYKLTDSALALGLVSAALGVPILLFSLFGGVIVDRVDKRKLLIVTHVLTAMTTLTIAVLISMGAIALWHLIIAAIAHGLILSFDLPGRQAIIPQLVGQRQIMNAIALGSGATNLTRIIAPALGGVLVGVMGIDGVYYLIVTCYVASVAFLLTMPALLTPTRDSRTTVRSDLIEGLRYIRRSPILPALLAMAIVPIAFGMPYMMLMPIIASDVFNVGASGLGYLMAAAGMGALAGSLLVASLGDFKHKGALLLVASASFGVFLILFANSNYFYIALFFLLGVGMANSIYMTTTNTLLQINTEDGMRGRVMSLYMMTIGLLPIAVLPASAIAQSLGGSIALGVGGAILLIFTLAMTLLRPTLRRL